MAVAEGRRFGVDRHLIREFLRFGLVGLGGMFVDIAALWVAINWMHAGYYLGRVISYLVAATFTWAVNRRFTFRNAAQGPLLKQWASYLVVNSAGAFTNLGVYSLIVGLGPKTGLIPALLLPYLPYFADACGGVCGMVFNYAGSKLFIFRAQSSSSSS
jgi:putative flippase GtrA